MRNGIQNNTRCDKNSPFGLSRDVQTNFGDRRMTLKIGSARLSSFAIQAGIQKHPGAKNGPSRPVDAHPNRIGNRRITVKICSACLFFFGLACNTKWYTKQHCITNQAKQEKTPKYILQSCHGWLYDRVCWHRNREKSVSHVHTRRSHSHTHSRTHPARPPPTLVGPARWRGKSIANTGAIATS